jgi:acyl-CoA dehydrogenase
MDVHGGRVVVTGPRNYLFNYYQGIPISVTVEGANIMSRNLLIFGQGSMACHPYARDEFYAISNGDKERFRDLIWKHIYYLARNKSRAICAAWTGGWLIDVPESHLKREYQKLSRLSYAYAWIADLSLVWLGGSLKRKERLSARLADGMSYLYMAMAALRYYQQQEEDIDQRVHAKWAVNWCFYQAQKSLIAFCNNFPSRIIGWLVRLAVFPLGQTMRYPADKQDHQLAKLMTRNNDYRNNLLKWVYLSGDSKQPVDKMENALQMMLAQGETYKKVSDLKRYKSIWLVEKLAEKVKEGVLSQSEMDALVEVEKARWDAIQVDEFSMDSMKKKTFQSVIDDIKTPFN